MLEAEKRDYLLLLALGRSQKPGARGWGQLKGTQFNPHPILCLEGKGSRCGSYPFEGLLCALPISLCSSITTVPRVSVTTRIWGN